MEDKPTKEYTEFLERHSKTPILEDYILICKEFKLELYGDAYYTFQLASQFKNGDIETVWKIALAMHLEGAEWKFLENSLEYMENALGVYGNYLTYTYSTIPRSFLAEPLLISEAENIRGISSGIVEYLEELSVAKKSLRLEEEYVSKVVKAILLTPDLDTLLALSGSAETSLEILVSVGEQVSEKIPDEFIGKLIIGKDM